MSVYLVESPNVTSTDYSPPNRSDYQSFFAKIKAKISFFLGQSDFDMAKDRHGLGWHPD